MTSPGFGTQHLGASSFGGARDITVTVGLPRARTLTATLRGGPVRLSPLDRLYIEVDVAAALLDGTPTTVTGVDVAVLPTPKLPDASTTWTPADYAAGVATVLLAGPAADPTDAVVVTSPRGDLWLRVTDIPEVQAVKASRVTID